MIDPGLNTSLLPLGETHGEPNHRVQEDALEEDQSQGQKQLCALGPSQAFMHRSILNVMSDYG